MFDTVKKTVSNKQSPSSPLPMILAQKFTQRFEHVDTPLREEMFHKVKQSVRKKNILSAPIKQTCSNNPIDPRIFRNYHPDSKYADHYVVWKGQTSLINPNIELKIECTKQNGEQ